MTPATICILGGTGFVGSQLASRLARRAGLRLRVLTRDPVRARHLSVLPAVELVKGNVHDIAVLRREFAGADTVVNLVGILNERGFSGRGFEQAHAELAQKVVAAATFARVPRLLHMSSLGAGEEAPSHYLRSKGRAEAHVRASGAGLHWTIFRPSVIFGAGDSLTRRFASLLHLAGGFLPLARASARFAPIYVESVVDAFERVLDGFGDSGQTYELCGPEIITLRELVERVAAFGGRRARVLALPDAIGRLQALMMDWVPGKPFSSDNFRSLTLDSVCSDPGAARLGLTPVALGTVAGSWLGPGEPHARRDRLRASAVRWR